MALTALDVEKAQPGQTAYKLFDRRGLYLLVSPTGAKLWKFKYRHQGIEKKLALGRYPDVGLAQARIACDAASVKVAAGQDPSGEKRLARLTAKWSRATTFAAVALKFSRKGAHRRENENDFFLMVRNINRLVGHFGHQDDVTRRITFG